MLLFSCLAVTGCERPLITNERAMELFKDVRTQLAQFTLEMEAIVYSGAPLEQRSDQMRTLTAKYIKLPIDPETPLTPAEKKEGTKLECEMDALRRQGVACIDGKEYTNTKISGGFADAMQKFDPVVKGLAALNTFEQTYRAHTQDGTIATIGYTKDLTEIKDNPVHLQWELDMVTGLGVLLDSHGRVDPDTVERRIVSSVKNRLAEAEKFAAQIEAQAPYWGK